jgi:tetratricopeptide (TPR) repeat protein
MIAPYLLFLALENTPPARDAAAGVLQLAHNNAKAQAQAFVGHNQLHLGRLPEARANCDAALNLDPTNQIAKDCLDLVAIMLIDQDLNTADAKLLAGDRKAALDLASKWTRSIVQADRRARAWMIVREAQAKSLREVFDSLTPPWLRDVLIAIITLSALSLMLQVLRMFWRERKRGEWFGQLNRHRRSALHLLPQRADQRKQPASRSSTTTWNMLPLKELPKDTGTQGGLSTNLVLDAMGRLGHELKRPLWQPKMLLLRPTPPADYEPALIDSFLSEKPPAPIVLAPATDDLCLEWEMHDVHLDEAVQLLQLKTGTGIDIGTVARFLRSIGQWFNTGAPTITGTAETAQDKTVIIHLAASGGPVKCTAVAASTAAAPGINPSQLSAERAVFKFLFRMRYPEMTTDEIDGFSALRQGVTQFAQYAGTVPGVGDNAITRRSSLAKAAFNLNFFRASIPVHCNLGCPSEERTSLRITPDIRQAVLLAEGVAYCLIASEHDRLERGLFHRAQEQVDHALIAEENHMSAIDCFRQLQDWPGPDQSLPLRQQAAYNEAVAWRQMGHFGQAVLMFAELLGLEIPDTVGQNAPPKSSSPSKQPLPEAIILPARLAMLSAFAQYDVEQWSMLPDDRAELLIKDAQQLVKDLEAVRTRTNISSHDKRLATYMHTETLRSLGHVTLLRIVTGPAKRLYENDRPLGLKTSALSDEVMADLQCAIFWLKECEKIAPSCSLYCDLAEGYLLRKEFSVAEAYGRHATLHTDRQMEAAHYIAAESFFLENTDASRALAKKYAESFKRPVTLEKFKALRRDLGIAAP